MCNLASSHKKSDLTPAPHPAPSIVPANPTCRAAYTFAAARLPPAILNHSLRVFLYATHLNTLPAPAAFTNYGWYRRNADGQATLTFLAAIFHDIGTHEDFDGEERFEVCGAEAAASWMEGRGMSGAERDDVWTAVACHTSAGIAEGIAPLARVIRLAVLADFGRPGVREEFGLGDMGREMEMETEGGLPRLEIERVLGDVVVRQILGKAEGRERARKAPGGSWPGGLLRGYLEMVEKGVEGVNIYF